MMCEEPQPTETDVHWTYCLAVRGKDVTEDGVDKGVPGQQCRDFQTLFLKEEDLEDGEGDKPTEKPDLHATGNFVKYTNFTNQADFSDEWIEDDKSSEELQSVAGEGLPYHMHIKEEISSEDEYQENDYHSEDTADMEMMAHSSSKQDKTSSTEESNEIVRSAKGISQKGGLKSVTPHRNIESETNGRASEENLPSKFFDTHLGEKSIHSPHRPKHDDYLKVVCVEVVDASDPDFCHEREQMNIPGEMDYDDEIHQYPMCVTSTPNESNSSEGMDTVANEKQFECFECQRRYTEKRSLLRHMEAHWTDQSHGCSLCGKEFSSEGRLLAHMRCHTAGRSFECSYCNKGFTDKCGLTRHIRIHTGEKPYECSLCDRLFSVKGNLMQHVKTHNGEKPFLCDICDKKFLHQSWLSRHVFRAHSEVRIKPFQCCVCSKCFSQKSDLTRHIKTHTRQKYFECSYCNKTFSTRGNFERHERTHVEVM